VTPPVEVMRTVVAVTEPVLPVEPNALTQSPTARAVAAAVWVSVRLVVFDVVIWNFWVLGLLDSFDGPRLS
jgi:hypothetical protein